MGFVLCERQLLIGSFIFAHVPVRAWDLKPLSLSDSEKLLFRIFYVDRGGSKEHSGEIFIFGSVTVYICDT